VGTRWISGLLQLLRSTWICAHDSRRDETVADRANPTAYGIPWITERGPYPVKFV